MHSYCIKFYFEHAYFLLRHFHKYTDALPFFWWHRYQFQIWILFIEKNSTLKNYLKNQNFVIFGMSLVIILGGLAMISTRCIFVLMPNLHTKSLMVSSIISTNTTIEWERSWLTTCTPEEHILQNRRFWYEIFSRFEYTISADLLNGNQKRCSQAMF